jgi:hypothetical protein
MDIAIQEVAWYTIKQKRWRNKTAVLPSLNKYSWCYFLQKHSPYSWSFVHDYKMTPHFLDDESGKNFHLIFK